MVVTLTRDLLRLERHAGNRELHQHGDRNYGREDALVAAESAQLHGDRHGYAPCVGPRRSRFRPRTSGPPQFVLPRGTVTDYLEARKYYLEASWSRLQLSGARVPGSIGGERSVHNAYVD